MGLRGRGLVNAWVPSKYDKKQKKTRHNKKYKDLMKTYRKFDAKGKTSISYTIMNVFDDVHCPTFSNRMIIS